MVSSSSVTITIRIPKELVDIIDGHIDAEIYSNRPDFIVCAIRFFWEATQNHIETIWELITKEFTDPGTRLYNYSVLMKDYYKTWRLRYEEYEGRMETIIIRLPVGLAGMLKGISDEGLGCKGGQDYARLSIPAYINYITSNFESYNNIIADREEELERVKPLSENIPSKNKFRH